MFTIIQEFTEKYRGFRGSLFSIHPLSGCERLLPREVGEGSDVVSDIFVLMPFAPELKPIYEDHIKKVATKLKLQVKRADDLFSKESVMRDVWNAVTHAKIAIADCTGRNPNVFYEIGIAHTITSPSS